MTEFAAKFVSHGDTFGIRRYRLLTATLAAALAVAGCSAPSSSASPSTAPSPSSARTPGVAACPAGGRMTAGTYLLDEEATQTVPASVTVPDGWSGCDKGLLSKEFGPPAGPALIGFWAVDNVYADPCHWLDGGLMDPAVGPTVADLATSLGDQTLTDASDPANDTLGGLPATHVQLRVPVNLGTTTCDEDPVEELGTEFRFWNGPGDSVWWIGAKDAPGLLGDVWAADLDGTRIVVQAAYFSDANQAEVDEVLAIVRSITFEP